MAGYRKKPNRDGFEVNFYTADKQRRSLWLQGASLRQAREFVRHLDELIRSNKAGVAPEADTAKWIDQLDGALKEKLVGYGLAQASSHRRYEPHERTVGHWTQSYIDYHWPVATLTTATTRTRNNYLQAREWLLKGIIASRDLASISPDDLRRWQRSMKDKLALGTRNKHVQRVRTMLRSAVEAKIITANPADSIKQERLPEGRRIDRSKQHFVNAEVSKQVIDGLATTKWKLIFAMLRFQGMRRHEALGLEWSQVDFATGTMQIKSLKTGIRECPIFPETRALLEQMASETDQLTGKVIPWATKVDSLTPLLSKRVKAILGYAWSKPCQQLRSTRRTELDEQFASHVVDEWLGHDSKTADKHYRQVTADHHARALAMPNSCSTTCSTVSTCQPLPVVDSFAENAIFPADIADSLDPSWGYFLLMGPRQWLQRFSLSRRALAPVLGGDDSRRRFR